MKIGALIPLWNQEKFIAQHLKMMRGVDKIVVLFEQEPLGAYQREHNLGFEKDRTEEIVKSFSNVEYHKGTYRGEFMAGLFNEGLKYVKDCDIVFKLDPDCFFTDKDWDRWISFIRAHPEYDCYKINCRTNSINYYGVDSFEFGIRDGLENEVYAFNPSKELHGVTSYDAHKLCEIDETWSDFTMHHFKGWKKQSTIDWARKYFKNQQMLTAPEEIVNKVKI